MDLLSLLKKDFEIAFKTAEHWNEKSLSKKIIAALMFSIFKNNRKCCNKG